ncbi:MAG: 30S ribosomal protein S5 [Dehalococcoidia bacterium]
MVTREREGDRPGRQRGGRGDSEGGQGGRGRGRGPRSRREEQPEDSGIVERVVKIRRVSKVVAGGRNLTFNAMVVVGDGSGKVGASLGKAGAVPDAVRKGTTNARKRMQTVTMNGTSIPHEVTARYAGAQVFLKPAAPGTGIIAGGGVRAVMEAAGIRDVLSKSLGSSNSINIVKATLKALAALRDPKEELARRRGVPAAPQA